jgi:UV DNA damage endonuclease
MFKQKIGFCCIALKDGSYDGTKFKSTTLSWCLRNKVEAEKKLNFVYSNNLKELTKVIHYCIEKKIWIYRISSDLFPLADHNEFEYVYQKFSQNKSNWIEAISALEMYYSMGGRCSTHPAQFCSIGSEKELVRISSIKCLEHHASFMDSLELPKNHGAHINIHLSNGKNPLPLIKNYRDSMSKLSIGVLSRLTFENEHSGFWTVSNIKSLFPQVPIVFDSLHYKCNPDQFLSFEEAFVSAFNSWKDKNPVFHHSQGKDSDKDKKHSDFIDNIPNIFSQYPVDIEFEAKAKNLAVLNYRKQLSEL